MVVLKPQDARSNGTETVAEAVREALSDGASRQEIARVVSAVLNPPRQQKPRNGPASHREAPQGTLTFSEAASKYSLSPRTIQGWVRTGRLSEAGRLRASARGGGKVLIVEAELVALLTNPPRRGRPPSLPRQGDLFHG